MRESRKAKQVRQWQACCRASNRIWDLVHSMYGGQRNLMPAATTAEIIAGELGYSIPEREGE